MIGIITLITRLSGDPPALPKRWLMRVEKAAKIDRTDFMDRLV